jgi:protein LSM14
MMMSLLQQFNRPNYNNQNKPNGAPQNNQGRANANNKTLKFDNEFDFEQANSKFEELRTQLAKLKVGTEEIKPEQVI